jgi:hypothetical protein
MVKDLPDPVCSKVRPETCGRNKDTNLTICKYAHVEAWAADEHRVHVDNHSNCTIRNALRELRDLLKHVRLRRRGLEHAVERKLPRLLARLAHRVLRRALQHDLAALEPVGERELRGLAVLEQRAHAAEHADVALELLDGVVERAPEALARERVRLELGNACMRALKLEPQAGHGARVGGARALERRQLRLERGPLRLGEHVRRRHLRDGRFELGGAGALGLDVVVAVAEVLLELADLAVFSSLWGWVLVRVAVAP